MDIVFLLAVDPSLHDVECTIVGRRSEGERTLACFRERVSAAGDAGVQREGLTFVHEDSAALGAKHNGMVGSEIGKCFQRTTVERHLISIDTERTIVDTRLLSEVVDSKRTVLNAYRSREVADIVELSQCRTLLDDLSVARDGITRELVFKFTVVESDGSWAHLILDDNRTGSGIVVESHVITRYEDIAGLLFGVGEVLCVCDIPCSALCAVPLYVSCLTGVCDGEHEVAVVDSDRCLVAFESGDNHFGDVAVDLLNLSKRIASCLHFSVNEVEVEARSKVLRSLRPVLCLDAHHLVHDDLVSVSVGVNVEVDNTAKAKCERVGGDGAHLILSAGTDGSAIISLDRGKRTTIAVEVGKAVEPEPAALQRSVEGERTGPHVSVARIALVDLGQHEGAVALLDESHGSGEGTTGECMGIDRGGDIVVVVVPLYPCRRVVEEDIGSRSVADADGHVVGLVEHHLFVVESCADGAAVVHDSASVGGLWWRSDGDALHLTEEVAHVWRLVIAVHLPYHGVAVLLVREQCAVAVFGGVCGGVDTYLVVGRTCHDFLSPVAEDVTLEAGRSLGVVVTQRTVEGLDVACTVFMDAEGGVAHLSAVERFFQKVAVPIDAEVQIEVIA